tara:strand:+ start:58 stop:273 length:216 start_codon:yes stop_codon:yes gene_type:complete
MKIVTFLYEVCRSLLSYLGLGGGNCLYYPTCSQAITKSLETNGLFKSIPVVLKRVAMCNPLYKKFGKNWQY